MSNKLIFKDAEKAKKSIMVEQQKEIAKLYNDWADDIAKKAEYYSHKTNSSAPLSERYYKELKTQLRKTSQQVSNEIYNKIKSNMYIVSDEVVKDNVKWLKSFGFSEDGLNAAFSYVPKDTVERLVTGQVYESGWSLSKRIWSDNEQALKDIYQVMARGVAEQKPIYDIAKDLESYVRPNARLPWNLRMSDGVKIYKKQVDYNAQRLARTLVQHSYQQSFVSTTKNNPFILDYVWRANGSRVCEVCAARNGVHYKKDELPLDHPNGMCVIEPSIDKNMNDKLADWFNSPDGTYPEIDEFARNFGYESKTNNKMSNNLLSHSDSYAGHLTNSVVNKFVEKFGITPDISSVSIDEKDFTNLMSGAYAYVEPSDGSLHINPNIFKDEKTFYETVGGRIRAYHPNATPESILAHEYGHSVSLKVDEKKIIDKAVARYVEKYPKSAMDEFIPDYQYAAESISHYAVTTEHELFAEAFGDTYANGDKAQELSKWIVEEVKRSMK